MPEPRTDAPTQRRLLRSAFTNWLAFAAVLLTSFFLSPYLIRKLGDSSYGVWIFVESIIAYFTLFDLGIAACLVRFTARYHTTGDRAELNRLASSALMLFTLLGVGVLVLGVALIPALLPTMQKSGLPSDEITGFLLLMLGNLAVTLPLSLFPAMLDGVERFALKSLVRIVFLAVKTIGTILVMEHCPGLLNLGILHTACNVAEHLVLAVCTFRILPGLRFSLRLVDRATLRLVRGYSLDAFWVMLSGRVCLQSAAIVIGLFLDAPHITWFAVGSRLVEYAKSLLRSATITLTPAISSMEAMGNLDGIRKVLLKGTRWALYLILPVQIGLMVFGRDFLDIWLGNTDYGVRCYPILLILAAPLAFAIAQSIAARILYGMDRLRWFARVAIFEAIINLGLSLWLVQQWGIVGVALATAVPNLICGWWVIHKVCGLIQIPIHRYLFESWRKPLIAVVPSIVIWLGINWNPQGWLDLGTALAAGLIPFAILVLVLEGWAGQLLRWIPKWITPPLGRRESLSRG